MKNIYLIILFAISIPCFGGDLMLSENDKNLKKFYEKDRRLFPFIPVSIGIDPMLAVFIYSNAHVGALAEAIGDEDMHTQVSEDMAMYINMLTSEQKAAYLSQIDTLIAYGKQEKWRTGIVNYLESLKEYGFN